MEYWAEAKSQLSPNVANTEFGPPDTNLSDEFEKITAQFPTGAAPLDRLIENNLDRMKTGAK